LGNLRQRNLVLATLQDLPRASVATEQEVLHFIDRHALFDWGSVMSTPTCSQPFG
jgi:hypothetical protein